MNAFDFSRLAAPETESLLYAIDGLLKVRRRFQFFLWTQGGLQCLIPHETLVCARGDLAARRFSCETFTGQKLDARFGPGLTDPVDGLLPVLHDLWHVSPRQAHLCLDPQTDARLPAALRAGLTRLGIARFLMHGAGRTGDEPGSFYLFLNGGAAWSEREAYLLELLVPHLHFGLGRIGGDKRADPRPVAVEVAADSVLSEREVQVLEWIRAGKTNQEIAQILDISPLTIKNHVQSILRKLKVANRAQAVAKGIAARLIAERETA